MLAKTKTINRFTYHKQSVKLNEHRNAYIKMLNKILLAMGLEPLDRRNFLSPAVADSVISEYLINSIVNNWSNFLGVQDMIRSHLGQHDSIIDDAVLYKLRDVLNSIDYDTLTDPNKEIYNVFKKWIEKNAGSKNIQLMFNNLIQQFESTVNLSNEQILFVKHLIEKMGLKTKMETKEQPMEGEPVGPIEEEKMQFAPQFSYAKGQFDEAWENQKDKGKVGKKSEFGTNSWIFDKLFLKKPEEMNEKDPKYRLANNKQIEYWDLRTQQSLSTKFERKQLKTLIEKQIKDINKILNKISWEKIEQTNLKTVFMKMFEIFDAVDFGANPIISTSDYNLNKIHHFLDWLMGREPIY